MDLPTFDLAGNSRISDYSIDIGAYEFEGTTSIFDDKKDNSIELRIFPNPTEGVLTVRFPNRIEANSTIRIFSVSGKLIDAIEVQHFQSSLNIDFSLFKNGIYLLVLKTNQRCYYTKLIKEEFRFYNLNRE